LKIIRIGSRYSYIRKPLKHQLAIYPYSKLTGLSKKVLKIEALTKLILITFNELPIELLANRGFLLQIKGRLLTFHHSIVPLSYENLNEGGPLKQIWVDL
jgi:hypothetical protein